MHRSAGHQHAFLDISLIKILCAVRAEIMAYGNLKTEHNLACSSASWQTLMAMQMAFVGNKHDWSNPETNAWAHPLITSLSAADDTVRPTNVARRQSHAKVSQCRSHIHT